MCHSFSVNLDEDSWCAEERAENFSYFLTHAQQKKVKRSLKGSTKISHLKSLKAAEVGEININTLSACAEVVFHIGALSAADKRK